ncbi:hypothetical protein Tsubulata_025489 [Turnera subulata]|uniref:Uncharacterized protein n=1 Tax=Turnera subulata TaxID=218843 RepID=A0A9Q0FIQ7_9ROSI|nr:hypothetical protein Tsubulata_025489 [Turnera subulata]
MLLRLFAPSNLVTRSYALPLHPTFFFLRFGSPSHHLRWKCFCGFCCMMDFLSEFSCVDVVCYLGLQLSVPSASKRMSLFLTSSFIVLMSPNFGRSCVIGGVSAGLVLPRFLPGFPNGYTSLGHHQVLGVLGSLLALQLCGLFGLHAMPLFFMQHRLLLPTCCLISLSIGWFGGSGKHTQPSNSNTALGLCWHLPPPYNYGVAPSESFLDTLKM